MKIYAAIVSHRHGNNLYLGRTEAELMERLADYCREWWDDFVSDDEEKLPAADSEAIEVYFGRADGLEWVDYLEDELPDPVPSVS